MQRRWWVWLLAPAAATTVLLVAVAVFAGDDDEASPSAVTTTRATTTTSTQRTTTQSRETTTRSKETTTRATTTTTTTTPATTTTTATEPRRIVPVPNLYGVTRREALEILEDAGFRGKARRERSLQPEGLVFSQKPVAGKRSRQGTTVSFAVAFYPAGKEPPPPPAPASSELPGVVGLDFSEAAARMEVLGMIADTYPVRSSRRVTFVTGQSPAPGTIVSRGTRVRLTVSTGRGRLPVFEVPDTVGLQEVRAHVICRDENFTCRSIVVSEGSPGRVVRQEPAAGVSRRALTQMKLYVGG